jgi:hypothetical protein
MPKNNQKYTASPLRPFTIFQILNHKAIRSLFPKMERDKLIDNHPAIFPHNKT